MAHLAAALDSVKSNLSVLLPAPVIHQAAAAVGHRWRRRELGPVRTVLLLVLQLLAANASLAKLRAMDGYRCSVSALSQARTRLPMALLQRLFDWLIAEAGSCSPRIVLLDAFNCYAPDTPALRKTYRHPRNKRCKADYPQLRTIGIFDLHTGLLLAQHHFACDRHESPQLRHLLPLLRSGDAVIFDRGFVSYANFCLLRQHGVQVISRLASNLLAKRTGGHTCVRRLGKGDRLVCWNKPPHPTTGWSKRAWKQLPGQLQLRQIAVPLAPGVGRCRRLTLISSLLDPQDHPATRIAQWYQRRWEIETNIRHLKQTLNFEQLRSRSPANIDRELLLRAIAYNLVRRVMRQAAQLRKLPPQRISFIDACRWLLCPHPGVCLLKLLINPTRQRSSRPRKIKYRGKNYRLLTSQPKPQYEIA